MSSVLLAAALALQAAAQESGPDGRVPWISSRITGSPEPPPPLRAVRAWPALTFRKPVHLVPMPDYSRWVVVEEEGTLHTVRNDPACDKADYLIDLRQAIRGLDKVERCKGVASCYSIAFDPEFAKNRFCYVMYVLAPTDRKGPLPNGSRVSRFKVSADDPPKIDPASEEVLVTWLTGGHNGSDLVFGNDGFLYISAGDAEDPSPPDKLRTGQDVSDLLSSVLRIDVRRSEGGRPYAIPPDNPFADARGARPEIWAYGFRNPWRMSVDRKTGRLWVGDVGWERMELVFCAEKGGNYGWSVMEGTLPCIPDAKRGPTPILPPAHQIPHPEGASITGGYVYRGSKLKGFEGRYFYGDWESRRVWANPVKENSLGDRQEVARTSLRIVAFAEDKDGELLMVDHEKGGLHRLEPNDAAAARNADFPRTLSATGIFSDLKAETPSAGVLPYSIHAARWADGASGQRWLGIPNREAINFVDKNKEWPKESVWPKDSVLVKTLTLEGRKVETQVLHYDGGLWNGYTYTWNEAQTDAALAPAGGAEVDLGGGRRWRVPARAACLACHNPWPGYALTFNAAQLPPETIQSFQKQGIIPKQVAKAKKLVDPHDESASLDERARAYLSVNCAHCHRFGGGGAARIDLRHEIPFEETRVQGVRPVLGGFDLTDPSIVSGGDPARSVLLLRASKLGHGRMPQLGSDTVDEKGMRLLARWIASLPAVPCDSAARAGERSALEKLRGGDAASIDRLLASTSGALDLIGSLDALPEDVRRKAIAKALEKPPGFVRDLFERFEPPGKRRERLGTSVKPERLLALKGDASRGQALYASPAVQCTKCHRVGAGAETAGPELTRIGAKYDRAKLLESLLEPSKFVDPKFAGYVVQTKSSDVYSGILVSKTEKEIVLRDVEKETRLPAGDVLRMAVQQTSLMPEGLLQHFTAQEAVDLLAYLESLK